MPVLGLAGHVVAMCAEAHVLVENVAVGCVAIPYSFKCYSKCDLDECKKSLDIQCTCPCKLLIVFSALWSHKNTMYKVMMEKCKTCKPKHNI